MTQYFEAAVRRDGVVLAKNVLEKEESLISEELKNSGKPTEIVKKISIGKINKFKENKGKKIRSS